MLILFFFLVAVVGGMSLMFVCLDFSGISAESPVLWLRVDPEMTLLRKVTWEQPDYMWQYQLKYERDVVAQCEVRIWNHILI